MVKFIKVTDLLSGKEIAVNLYNVNQFVPLHLINEEESGQGKTGAYIEYSNGKMQPIAESIDLLFKMYL